MKELTIEQKAQRHDEAIERLRNAFYDNSGRMCEEYRKAVIRIIEPIFPELKESEDERTRKVITDIVKAQSSDSLFNGTKEKCLAWLEKQGKLVAYYEDKLDRCACGNFNKGYKKALEKQGEKKHAEWHREDEQNLNACLSYIPDEFLRRWLTDIIHVKYDKSADKVEPKFKVGDLITNGVLVGKIDEIQEYCSEFYYFTNFGDYSAHVHDVENWHKWTIQDAKDGDVLFQDLMGGKTFIYNGVNSDKAILYSFIISNDGEDVLPYHIGKPNTGIGNIEENKNIIYPATKEQRSLLFQKMKESGYEWDAKKMKLKKIKEEVR